jgi:hypothetical protein
MYGARYSNHVVDRAKSKALVAAVGVSAVLNMASRYIIVRYGLIGRKRSPPFLHPFLHTRNTETATRTRDAENRTPGITTTTTF